MGKINSLSLDLETYSDVDLNKCGVYKYAQSHAFEILLFGVSVNGGEVQVYDLAQGESVPMEIVKALTDNSVLKWAFNASFERVCLSVWLQRYYPQYFESYSIHEDTVGDYLAPPQHGAVQWCGRHIWDCRCLLQASELCMVCRNRNERRQRPHLLFLCSMQADTSQRRQDKKSAGT